MGQGHQALPEARGHRRAQGRRRGAWRRRASRPQRAPTPTLLSVHARLSPLFARPQLAPLHSTLKTAPVKHRAIAYHGHQTPASWAGLLAGSKFMLGLGDPLLGPSAVDAVVAGCMYINPIYDRPVKEIYASQHPYMVDHVGEPYVCSARLRDLDAVRACVRKALGQSLPPMIPRDFTLDAYLDRLRKIFGAHLPKPGAC